jgi:DNA-binding LacI/PurR family transcriptional regulator
MALSPDFEKRPTLRAIAAVAGVTHATVSMALRNSPLISSRTRQRVQRIAEKMGYRPDPEVAKLMQHLRLKHKPRFKSTIAALTSIGAAEEAHYAAALREGAQRAADALGYGFSVFRIEAGERRSTSLQRMLRGRGVEAVLLLPMKEAVSLRDLIEWDDYAVVAATYGVRAPDFHRVVPDQFGNTKLICEQLARRGCRRLGLVIDSHTDLAVDHRFSAAVAWQNIVSGAASVGSLVRLEDVRVGLPAWFARERPDAIIAGTETEARNIARELRLRLPGPVEFAVTERPGPTRLAGIDQRPAEIGAAAIAQLHARLQSGQKGVPDVPSVTMIKGLWVPPKWTRAAG